MTERDKVILPVLSNSSMIGTDEIESQRIIKQEEG